MIAIQRSIISALQYKHPLKSIEKIRSGTLVSTSESGNEVVVVSCEDDWKNILVSDGELSGKVVHLLRIWFNQPSQLDYAASANWPTTEVAFFKEFNLRDREVQVFDYAPESTKSMQLFASGVRRSFGAATSRKIIFIGEVLTHQEIIARYGGSNYEKWNSLVGEVLDGNLFLADIARNHTSEEFIFGFQNLFRQTILRDVIQHFGRKQVTLVGSDWRKLGFHSYRTMHSSGLRRFLQSVAGVCLDTGSKSTWSLWYPRLNELIDDGGLISTGISEGVKGTALGAFCHNRWEVLDAIAKRTTDAHYSASLDEALVLNLSEKRKEFRSKMANLFEGIIE